MGMSVNMQKVHDKAEKLDWKLPCSLFNGVCHIIHEDRSTMTFHDAFFAEDGDYIVCFTEHNGVHTFCKEDLLGWQHFLYDTEFAPSLDGLLEEYLK